MSPSGLGHPAQPLAPPLGPWRATQRRTTNWSGSFTGSLLSMTASIRLKIAVLAPMPKASVVTATAVKPGFFSSVRMP